MAYNVNDCVELRWGDDGTGCPDQAGKRRWYAVEQVARHEVDRDAGLTGGPQDVDIRGLILAMPARTPFVQHYPGDRRQSLN